MAADLNVWEIMAIPPNMVRHLLNNFKLRLQECAQRDGKPLVGIILKIK
jgi:hypothetical protein